METIRDFIELAIDSQRISVFNLESGKIVFSGTTDDDISDELLDLEVCSWDVDTEDKSLCFNVSMEEKKTCCICGKEFTEWGNNPWPFEGDTCCDECNWSKVIPARVEASKNKE